MGIWRALRGIPSWVWPALIAVLLLTVPFWGLDFSTTRQIQLALTLALMTSGLNLSLGYAGELALGQAAMYAAGAYGAGYVSKHFSTDIVLQLVVAGVLALVVGIITGVPGLRLGSWSLAMTSFFLVLLVPDLLAIFKEETGGRNGLSGIKNPTLFGSVLDSHQLFWVMAIVVILWFAFMRNLVTSRTGIAFRVLKQSPVLASSMGISVYRMKLQAYALGAVPAGLAGALFANIDRYLSPESFGFGVTTTVLAASILGGSASIVGAAVGAFIMQFGPEPVQPVPAVLTDLRRPVPADRRSAADRRTGLPRSAGGPATRSRCRGQTQARGGGDRVAPRSRAIDGARAAGRAACTRLSAGTPRSRTSPCWRRPVGSPRSSVRMDPARRRC